MKNFRHLEAESVAEALSLLRKFKGRANLIAGGTDLLGVLKGDILPDYPEALINIKTIPELNCIEENHGRLKIGALTKLIDIVQSPMIKKKYAMLAEAAASVAAPEIRNMGTMGGNLCQDTRCWYYRYPHSLGGRIECYRKGKGPCHAIKGDNRYHAILGGKKCFAVCPSDLATVLAALDANIQVVYPEGEKMIPVAEFYEPRGHVLKPDEMVTAIHVPEPPKEAAQSFLKFRLREAIDFAIVSVAVVIAMVDGVCQDTRIFLGAVAPAPYRTKAAEEIINGRPLDARRAEAAAEKAVAHAKPLSKNGYKIEIAKTLIRRAILRDD
jgi:xanthine dehydrogenase YagS FAD-binding subunit